MTDLIVSKVHYNVLYLVMGHPLHQQKRTLRLIRRRCVLAQATHLLRPMRPVGPDLCCNAAPYTTLPDATWQHSLRPDATWRPPYVWTTPDSFSHVFFLLMRR